MEYPNKPTRVLVEGKPKQLYSAKLVFHKVSPPDIMGTKPRATLEAIVASIKKNWLPNFTVASLSKCGNPKSGYWVPVFWGHAVEIVPLKSSR